MGDEAPWPTVTRAELSKIFDVTGGEDESIESLIARATERWEVFHLFAEDGSYRNDVAIHERWRKLLGERMVSVEDSSLVCEVIAGIIHGLENAYDADRVVSDLGLSAQLLPRSRTHSCRLSVLVPLRSGGRERVERLLAVVRVWCQSHLTDLGRWREISCHRFLLYLSNRRYGGYNETYCIDIDPGLVTREKERPSTTWRVNIPSQSLSALMVGHRQLTTCTRRMVVIIPFPNLGVVCSQTALAHFCHSTCFDPYALISEAAALETCGVRGSLSRIAVDGAARTVTPFQKAANRLREVLRGTARHGSVGMGIGETMADQIAFPDLTVYVGDLRSPGFLSEKSARVQELKRAEFAPQLERLRSEGLVQKELALLEDPSMPKVASTMADIARRITIASRSTLVRLAATHPLIFEGRKEC